MIINYLDQIKKQAREHKIKMTDVRREAGMRWYIYLRYMNGVQNIGYPNAVRLDKALQRLIKKQQAA